uniref:Uncharacterized protein n=1 Tax=Anguilla anguilla TaxID=7936 RepID=A0A0E9PNZ4_ANGAN
MLHGTSDPKKEMTQVLHTVSNAGTQVHILSDELNSLVLKSSSTLDQRRNKKE